MSNMQYVYLGLIFLAVVSGVFGIATYLFRDRTVQNRLRAATADGEFRDAAPTWQAKVVKMAEPVAKLALPTEGLEYSRLRTRFLNAGYRNQAAIVVFFAAKIAFTLLLPLLAVTYVGLAGIKVQPNLMLVWVLVFAALGFLLPNYFLSFRVSRRQRALFEAFPDAIDLLVVCVEAGLGLDAAINRAAEEMRVRSPDLAEELNLVTLELRVGASREEALRNLAVRTGLDDVNALATMLIQADRFGTNVADALRVHADSLRHTRFMRAEEAAAKVPVKLVFPIVLCIFPTLMLVLGGPAFISVYRTLLPVLAR